MLNEDKRRFMRMMVNANVKITLLETGLSIEGTCNDLSATGLSIEIEDPVDMNTMVDIYIDSKSASTPPLSAHAKVVRCSQEQDGKYLMGLEITQFN
jgi:hypothetical protein